MKMENFQLPDPELAFIREKMNAICKPKDKAESQNSKGFVNFLSDMAYLQNNSKTEDKVLNKKVNNWYTDFIDFNQPLRTIWLD